MIAQNVAVAPARLNILSRSSIRSYAPHCASCEHVAVAPARIKIPHCLKLFFICSHLLAHEKVAVAPTRIKISMFSTLCPHLLHSKSSKNLKDLHQSWTAYVFVLCALMHFRSKTTVIISLFGMPSFVVAFLLFIFLIFPLEILTFCSIHVFLIS